MIKEAPPRLDGQFMLDRFLEGLAEVEPSLLDQPIPLWDKQFFDNETHRLAVIRGLQYWVLQAQAALPGGLGGALLNALRALEMGEETWLRPAHRGAGRRSKPFTRETYDLCVSQEIEFLRGLHAAENIAYFEATGRAPRRDKSLAGRARKTEYAPIQGPGFEAYKKAKAKLIAQNPLYAELISAAYEAGDCVRTDKPMSERAKSYYERRQALLHAHHSPIPTELFAATFQT